MTTPTPTIEQLRDTFRAKADCYADQAVDLEMQAMTEERFVEAVSSLLTERDEALRKEIEEWCERYYKSRGFFPTGQDLKDKVLSLINNQEKI